ncbi:hypothetical protein [Helicobacter canis]|uniref:hypothetical protein n=1 Tax=Helicobacter canis TaxID=29419 RepID=UPI0026F12E6C|nr:hypothetical protein [Helicobacter canis]
MRLKALSLALSLGAGIAVASVIFSGCGVITNGTKQKVLLTTSNGKSVMATIDGQKVKIPAEVSISRKGANIQVLHIDNPNYEDSFLSIGGQGDVSVGFWLDIVGIFLFILPGLTSVGVDAATGGMYQYSNTTWTIPLQEKK